MNTDVYPWSEVDRRDPPGPYVNAWRRVHDVFAQARADNVSWIWSPNVPFPQTTDLASLYPGDDYVDAVALDGYNWSTVLAQTTWQSFNANLSAGIDELRELTSRPILIGEVASAEQGGDKAAWVRDMSTRCRLAPTSAASPGSTSARGPTGASTARRSRWPPFVPV
jgi:beta-mannanase